MEQLYKIKRISFLFIFLGYISTYAQNDFFVYKTEGAPKMMLNDTLRNLTKGTRINNKCSINIKSDDKLLFINEFGQLFKLANAGTYFFKDLKNLNAIKDKSSFTKKYFTYVWKQFTNNTGNKVKTGVVYRTDNIVLMQQPADSIKIYFPEIQFSWNRDEEKDETLYFILKEKSKNHITKIGTNNTSLTLFIDNQLLKRGKEYQWAVSKTKYPNFEKVKFYSFELLDSKQFKAIQEELSELTKDLEKLGFNSSEIKKMICEDYKVCY